MKYGQTLRGKELREYRASFAGQPNQLASIEEPGINAQVWLTESKRGPVAIAFAGNRKNPDFHYQFKTAEARALHVQNWLASLRERAGATKARQVAARAAHTLEVGSILYASWGYEQTNIDFYQVVEVVGKRTVKVQAISSRIDHSSAGADYVVAVPDSFHGDILTKRASSDNNIRISSYSSAGPWDGQAKYETAAGWGH